MLVDVTEDIRKEAYRIARARDGTGLSKKLKTSFSNPQPHLSTLRGHWIGAIGEIVIGRTYPTLTPYKTLDYKEDDDFTLNGFRIEVKTEVWRNHKPNFLAHAGLVQRHKPDLILFCTLNNEPDKCTLLVVHGYMHTEDVVKCFLMTHGSLSHNPLPNPAYCVIPSDLKDFDQFYKAHQPVGWKLLLDLF